MHPLRFAAIALLVAGQAIAQPVPSVAPLAGPKVPGPQGGPTLIEHDYTGRVRRVDTTPEQEALARLSLDAGVRDAVERVMAARARVLDEVIGRNVDLLTQLGTAGSTGDRLDLFLLLAEFYRQMQPVRDRGPLRAEIAAVLPTPVRAEFDALVDGYWNALLAEGKASGKPLWRFQILAEERFRILSGEVERSFERVMEAGKIDFRYLLKGLELTPDQNAMIETMLAAYETRTKGSPTENERNLLFLRILAHLDADQRRLLLERVMNQ